MLMYRVKYLVHLKIIIKLNKSFGVIDSQDNFFSTYCGEFMVQTTKTCSSDHTPRNMQDSSSYLSHKRFWLRKMQQGQVETKALQDFRATTIV